MKFLVKDIELYLSEVGDDPDLQFTPQEEYDARRCLGRWTAKDEDDLKDDEVILFIILEFIDYEVKS